MVEIMTCRLGKRKSRFVFYVYLNGKKSTAYLGNTGRLEHYLREGERVYCVMSSGKNPYKIIAIGDAIVDTNLHEKIVAENIEKIFPRCEIVKRNPKFDNSTFDYLLDCMGKKRYLEIKSALYKDGKFAGYPDCISKRGRRHIKELTKLGSKGILLFVAAFKNAEYFRPLWEVDDKILDFLIEAKEKGVTIKAVKIYFEESKRSFKFMGEIPVVLERNINNRRL